ncbi:MAG TPA: hypothetical protein VGC80_13055, partial [Acetobacteraceae bacterium]
AGAVASVLGAMPAVAIGGAGVLLMTVVWMVLFPQLRRVRTYDDLSAAQVLSGQPASGRKLP